MKTLWAVLRARVLETSARLLLCGVVVALSAGCASRNTVPPYMPSMAPPAQAAPAQPLSGYRLDYGDTVLIRFPFHKELDSDAMVRPDGRITVSGLGDFYAAGRTTTELESDIYSRASITNRNPTVSVMVSKYSEDRAYIGGEVRRPGFVALRPGMTALRAIMERGGFMLSSETQKVVLIRWSDDGTYSASQLDLREVLETGDTTQDLALGANDMVYVPPTGIANATAWVQQYIRDLLPVREPTLRGPDVGR